MVTSPPDLGLSASPVTVVAATGVEARPLRRRLHDRRGVRVVQSGIALAALATGPETVVISCGLAGSLDESLPTGTVVIPESVALDVGPRTACDAELSERLRAAAERCGVVPRSVALVTCDHVVCGAERRVWAARGYAAVDMETALLARTASRMAAVRVVIDSPARELSPLWESPRRAAARPWLWGEAAWLARTAPRLCDLAARIVAEAL